VSGDAPSRSVASITAMTRKARGATRAFALSAVRSDYLSVTHVTKNPADPSSRARARAPAITLEMAPSETGGDTCDRRRERGDVRARREEGP
jgi:hypothetical protein